MVKNNIPDAKNRILKSALNIFAKKSFEGSRIDEIASEANVPKSLIYYHFKNKNELLKILITDFLKEYTELLNIAKDDTHQIKASEMPNRRTHYRDFLVKNTDLIRIIFIDSLKKSTSEPSIFKIVEAYVESEKGFRISETPDKYDKNERLIAEFFTNIIPMFAFLCFHNSWSAYFDIEGSDLEQQFIKIFEETHGAYHKNHD